MKILVFIEGTVLMHKGTDGINRKDIVEQSKNREKSVKEYFSYIPIGNCVNKLKMWKSQNVQLFYLTSRTKANEVNDMNNVLKKFDFPKGKLLFRKNKETYGNVAEKIIPDVLIEDDCESIGFVSEMTFPKIKSNIKKRVKSIIIKEFGGIDFLPDKINALLNYC